MRTLLREKVFNKHYSKLLKTRKERSRKPSVNTISSVTILTSSDLHTISELYESAKYFRKIGMVCFPYLVIDKIGDIDYVEDIQLIHTENSKYGVPNQEVLIKWLANKTDLLIVTSPARELIIKYLCAASNSKLKSSLKYGDEDAQQFDIDLWLDVNEDKGLTLKQKCKLIYSMLINLGIRPPLIGE